MLRLDSPIKTAPGVGPAQNKALNRVGVQTARDLLFYFPFRYIDFSKFTAIKDVKPGEIITIRGFIKTIQARYSFRGRVSLCEAIISDETGSLKVIWFNQPYLAKSLKSGDEVLLSGKADIYKTLQLQNPVYEKAADETISRGVHADKTSVAVTQTPKTVHTGRIVPVYRLTEGLYNRTVRNLISKFLPLAETLPEILPGDLLRRYSLPALPEAIRQIHFPDSDEQINAARERIIFEQALIQQLAVQQHKLLLQKLPAPKIPRNVELVKNFLATLPFELTAGQKQALWQIMKDMDRDRPMNRLLEGDVGSGKTLIAMAAILEAAAAGSQTVLVAPTEILAKQHYETFRKTLLENESIKNRTEKGAAGAAINTGTAIQIGLLTSQFHEISGKRTGDGEKAADNKNSSASREPSRKIDKLAKRKNNPPSRQQVIDNIKSGAANILIGTHALFNGDISFHDLALVVIDEQHRFGVEQRALLLRKARQDSNNSNEHDNSLGDYQSPANYQTPHLLSMSATPIPRTLALAFYGDLDISTLTELPAGRQTVATKIVGEADREQTYQIIKKELRDGRQAFVITPRVEESMAPEESGGAQGYTARQSIAGDSIAVVKSVKKEFKRLSEEVFPEFKLGLLYGKMTTSEKDKVMTAFNAGELDLLVATSVIDIGIDVPNAAIMLIEGAERFGLAQLHQLRGRVGRGRAKSQCFLFLTDEASESRQRLEVFASSHDGFKLAELDLQQRGMGSLFGNEQTGFPFKFSQFLTLKVLRLAKEAAADLIKIDPQLKQATELKQRVDPLIEQIHLE